MRRAHRQVLAGREYTLSSDLIPCRRNRFWRRCSEAGALVAVDAAREALFPALDQQQAHAVSDATRQNRPRKDVCQHIE